MTTRMMREEEPAKRCSVEMLAAVMEPNRVRASDVEYIWICVRQTAKIAAPRSEAVGGVWPFVGYVVRAQVM